MAIPCWRRNASSVQRAKVYISGAQASGYPRAFGYSPTEAERSWAYAAMRLLDLQRPVVLDPTAGGGSIPFESLRLGLDTCGNDLNPVATLIQMATVQWPLEFGIPELVSASWKSANVS